MLVAGEGITPSGAEPLVVDAVDGEVHLRHPPGLLNAFLAIDRDILRIAVVFVDELLGLHKHASGTAARVIHPPTRRLQHLHDHLDHAGRGKELATPLPFRASEIAEEVFVDLTHQIPGAVLALPAEARTVK
ncbi:Uncharacterised protein [Mycobacterium tuberculosis]|nr:Uncharacterised protein [Mycobacterium tuberculosis]COX10689.1 Uncharacterised protein [Mycobacterium tuberculosis]COX87517.1 Uncharacterised protein [Mycobacterium tuberculosis]